MEQIFRDSTSKLYTESLYMYVSYLYY